MSHQHGSYPRSTDTLPYPLTVNVDICGMLKTSAHTGKKQTNKQTNKKQFIKPMPKACK